MKARIGVIVALSCVYWAIALILLWLAAFAPCGLAPGAWCEMDGPNWFGAILGFLAPLGVFIVALTIYGLGIWRLTSRQRKQH